MITSTNIQKLWNYCNVLRDDGMSDEPTKAPYNQKQTTKRCPTKRCQVYLLLNKRR